MGPNNIGGEDICLAKDTTLCVDATNNCGSKYHLPKIFDLHQVEELSDVKMIENYYKTYNLSDNSPAIDAGDDSAITESTDLAGNPRKVNDMSKQLVSGKLGNLFIRVH